MQFSKKHKIIFLDPNTDSINTDEKLHVVISPSLYWVKKISLPVTKISEVKKLLPSIFEDSLIEGKYSYFAYKSENSGEFYVFAYEDKKILETLNAKNIPLTNVQSVHFAQSELMEIDGAVKINEMQSLYIKDDILVLVPCCWIEEKSDLNVKDITLSKHKIQLAQFGHIVDTKSLYKVGAILSILLVLILGELFITKHKTQNIVDLKDTLFEKNGLKPTMFQNRALLDKYENLHVKQSKIKELVSNILSQKLAPNEEISFISLKNNKIFVNLTNSSNNSKINTLLKSKKIKHKSTLKKTSLSVEISL